MIPFLYAASVYVAGRIFWSHAASLQGALRNVLVSGLQLAALFAVLQPMLPATAGMLASPLVLSLLATGAEFLARDREYPRLWLRLAVLALGIGLLSYATRSGATQVRPAMDEAGRWLVQHFASGAVLSQLRDPRFWAHLLGLLAAVSEAGTLVQASMLLLRVGKPADGHFQSSAVIGSVERLLVLVFVFHNAFNAIAFILTAKGVVRFHELSEKGAAEYVLVGTLLSTLCAIAIGLLVPLLVL